MSRTINAATLALVKEFEGLVLVAAPDIVGVSTVGYGHTGPDVHNGMRITEAQAEDLLRQDMADACADVTRLIHVPLTDNQFGALVSLVFNVGAGALTGTHLQALLNAGGYAGAAQAILKFDHAGGRQVNGLTRRRVAERKLFLIPDTETAPARWKIIVGDTTFDAVLVNDHTYAPVRALAEALGYTVTVDGQTVTLTKAE